MAIFNVYRTLMITKITSVFSCLIKIFRHTKHVQPHYITHETYPTSPHSKQTLFKLTQHMKQTKMNVPQTMATADTTAKTLSGLMSVPVPLATSCIPTNMTARKVGIMIIIMG